MHMEGKYNEFSYKMGRIFQLPPNKANRWDIIINCLRNRRKR